MYSPNLKPEALSPSFSPITFHLDDQGNRPGNNIQSFLLSPTKLNLDSGPSIYRTSLSKLNELARSSRSRDRRGSDTIRSTSPIRFQLLNKVAAPKMLKSEYIAPSAPTLPLLNTLMKHATTQATQKTSSQSGLHDEANLAATITTCHTGHKSSIKETLEKLQQQVQEIQLKESETPQRKISEAKSTASGITLCDNHEIPSTIDEQPKSTLESHSEEGFASDLGNSSREELNMDMLPTDRNGFVQYNTKGNRYSFLSSTSTDFDVNWFNGQAPVHSQQQNPSHQQFSYAPIFEIPNEIQQVSMNLEDDKESIERQDYRIKKLELQIEELRLQNEKLLRSLTASHIIDENVDVKLSSSSSTRRRLKQYPKEPSNRMESKVKLLEKKLGKYKKLMQVLLDADSSPTKDMDDSSSVKTRISRISNAELQKVEESESSASSSEAETGTESEVEEEIMQEGNLTRYTKDSTRDKRQSLTSRKGGLHLNIQILK